MPDSARRARLGDRDPDAKKLGVDPPKAVPATIQERAWASPIWYTPDPKLVKKEAYYPDLRQLLPE